ncbi:MAG: hypothetical protein KDA55_15205 [Planctomycetales bacterium]|nr:hypothetical protein [Planctomycetales bacterium]
MAIQTGKDAFAYIMFRENAEYRVRRLGSVQIQSCDGDVRYYEGADIPFHGMVLDCGELNRKKVGTAQILGVPTKRTYVDSGPAWPIGRGIVIVFAIIGLIHALTSFVSALQ